MKAVAKKHPVPADLQPYIESFWSYDVEGPTDQITPVQFCLPGGMVELILHLTPELHQFESKGQWIDSPKNLVVGIQSSVNLWKAAGGTALYGINIKPEAFILLFNKPIGELADKTADLTDYLGQHATSTFVEQLHAAPDSAIRTEVAANFFRQKVAAAKKRDHHYLPEAMEYIRSSTGAPSVDDVCGKVFVGKRQLQRIFQEQIGLSPKTYGRIVRFKSAYEFVHQYPKASWSDITYHFGYSDQSHFIRDFKAFTGNNPTSFMSVVVPVADLPFAMVST